jgi:hypothetical protein
MCDCVLNACCSRFLGVLNVTPKSFLWFVVFQVYYAFVWLFCVVVNVLLYHRSEVWG